MAGTDSIITYHLLYSLREPRAVCSPRARDGGHRRYHKIALALQFVRAACRVLAGRAGWRSRMVSSVSLAFGSSGAINPFLSAIITPIIAITSSITILLYTEES